MNMVQRGPVVTATLAIFLLIEITLNAEAVSPKRRFKEKIIVPPQQKNICDINERDSKVHCYCENTHEPKNATKAECWVFNGGIPRDDNVWHSFVSQPKLLTLSFNVRVDGALDYVPTIALQYLNRLQKIYIKYGNIAVVESYAFANLSSLSSIFMVQNQIESLEEFAISNLRNLTVIAMDDNLLTEIKKDSFYNLSNLQNLTLSRNNITYLEDGCFKQLVNLIDLELNKNSIVQLNRRTFDGLANLQRLDLKRNRLHTLNDFTFTELWNLSELLLGRNELKTISERAFDGLSQLRKLSLNDNKLKALPSGLFEGVRGLNALDLRNNNLVSLTYKSVKPILDNLYNPKSSIFLEGNDLVCNCHLKWILELRNETRSLQTRSSVEAILCRIEDTSSPLKVENYTSELNESNAVENVKSLGKDRKLISLPIEMLTCKREKLSTTEMPPLLVQLVSVQSDIVSYTRKDFSSSGFTYHNLFSQYFLTTLSVFFYFFAVG